MSVDLFLSELFLIEWIPYNFFGKKLSVQRKKFVLIFKKIKNKKKYPFLVVFIGFFLGFFVCVFYCQLWSCSFHSVPDSGSVLFWPPDPTDPLWEKYPGSGMIFIIYILSSFLCRILRHRFKEWGLRLGCRSSSRGQPSQVSVCPPKTQEGQGPRQLLESRELHVVTVSNFLLFRIYIFIPVPCPDSILTFNR